MMNDKDRQRIAYWVELLLDDQISAIELDDLEKAITDAEARSLYLHLMYQNASLNLDRVRVSAVQRATPGRRDGASRDEIREAVEGHHSKSAAKHTTSALAVCVAASLVLFAWWKFSTSSDTVTVIAEIVDSSDAVWAECTLPTAVGSQLKAGRLKINRGLVTIRFTSGAEVILESPAELILETPMRGTLLAGIAVVDVPESAHGFTIATPTAEVIDHGTAFAVIVDAASNVSSVEVVAGEVEVRHSGSESSRRLLKGQRVTATEESLSGSARLGAELSAPGRLNLSTTEFQRVTTAMGVGRDATVHSGSVSGHSSSELVLIKNPFEGYERYGRKGYFAFDLSRLKGDSIESARFILTLQPSGLGFASRVPDCEFTVYGLTNESHDDWSAEQLDWATAPANLPGATELDAEQVQELGRFVVTRGQQYGQVSIEGQKLVDFLKNDTNQTVSLVVVRDTIETQPDGLVHGFAGRFSTTAAPPTLQIGSNSE